jgi:hypothetical protein
MTETANPLICGVSLIDDGFTGLENSLPDGHLCLEAAVMECPGPDDEGPVVRGLIHARVCIAGQNVRFDLKQEQTSDLIALLKQARKEARKFEKRVQLTLDEMSIADEAIEW